MLDAPSDLGPDGRALWSAVTGSYDLEPHHGIALGSACRCADMLTRLEFLLAGSLEVVGSTGQLRLNPAVGELRQGRLALSRLLLDLSLPAEVAGPVVLPPATLRASRAANVRWARERRAAAGQQA